MAHHAQIIPIAHRATAITDSAAILEHVATTQHTTTVVQSDKFALLITIARR